MATQIDHQVYINFKADAGQGESSLQDCIFLARPHFWNKTVGVQSNKLKIGDSKTDFIIILGGKRQLQQVTIKGLNDGDSLISPSSNARNLGFTFGENFSVLWIIMLLRVAELPTFN